MNVSVYSREQIEKIIAENKFPPNQAVISFYDPAIKRIDRGYTHVDYSEVCKDVFYSELNDLNLEILGCKGYTYDTYFPEADDIAKFIIKAYINNKDIICQCEYGQNRSPGCAAAILEYFYHNGISIFVNYNYYPNKVVYHKIYDAIKRQKRYFDNEFYYAADTSVIKKHIKQLQLPETLLADYQLENSHSVVDLKSKMEKYLSEKNMLFHSQEEIINALLKNNKPVYASFEVRNPFYLYWSWYPEGVGTYFRYGCEEIPVYIYFTKYYFNITDLPLPVHRLTWNGNTKFWLGSMAHFKSLSFFGKLSLDSERKMIDAVPLIILNLRR